MTHCHPDAPTVQCEACALRSDRFPRDPEARPHVVLIDASSLGAHDDCPMFERVLMLEAE